MRKNENKTSKFVCIVLLLCVIAMILVAGTYAKYVSSAKGTATATVAGWDITVNGTKLGVEEEDIELYCKHCAQCNITIYNCSCSHYCNKNIFDLIDKYTSRFLCLL